MSAISKRIPKPSMQIVDPVPVETHHTCMDCPVRGTEECSTLQELGMYCDTAFAAFEAARARPGPVAPSGGRSGERLRRALVAVGA